MFRSNLTTIPWDCPSLISDSQEGNITEWIISPLQPGYIAWVLYIPWYFLIMSMMYENKTLGCAICIMRQLIERKKFIIIRFSEDCWIWKNIFFLTEYLMYSNILFVYWSNNTILDKQFKKNMPVTLINNTMVSYNILVVLHQVLFNIVLPHHQVLYLPYWVYPVVLCHWLCCPWFFPYCWCIWVPLAALRYLQRVPLVTGGTYPSPSCV